MVILFLTFSPCTSVPCKDTGVSLSFLSTLILAHPSEYFPDLSSFHPNHPSPFLLQHSGQLLAGLLSLLGTLGGFCQDTGPEKLPANKLNTLHLPTGQFIFSLNFLSHQRPQEVVTDIVGLLKPLLSPHTRSGPFSLHKQTSWLLPASSISTTGSQGWARD